MTTDDNEVADDAALHAEILPELKDLGEEDAVLRASESEGDDEAKAQAEDDRHPDDDVSDINSGEYDDILKDEK